MRYPWHAVVWMAVDFEVCSSSRSPTRGGNKVVLARILTGKFHLKYERLDLLTCAASRNPSPARVEHHLQEGKEINNRTASNRTQGDSLCSEVYQSRAVLIEAPYRTTVPPYKVHGIDMSKEAYRLLLSLLRALELLDILDPFLRPRSWL
jgi:hypothetical protein